MDKWLAPSFTTLTSEFSDCSVTVGSKTFLCHKVILASASEFFKGMLQSSFIEAISGEIRLENVTPDIFEKFRKYVYTYNKNLLLGYDNATLIDLYVCGNQWLVPSITSDCLDLLTERAQSMQVHGLIELYEFAHIYENKSFLTVIVSILLEKHKNDLLCDRVLLLGPEAFRKYMSTVAKNKSEIQCFRAIQKFVEINGLLKDINYKENETGDDQNKLDRQTNEKLKVDFVKSLLLTVDFEKMSGTEFYLGPGKSGLLTYQTKFEMMYKIFIITYP